MTIAERDEKIEKTPSGARIIWRELVRDKIAITSLAFLVIVALFVYISSFILDLEEVTKIDLPSTYLPPSSEFWLGTDYGGRDIFGQLIIGTRNSLTIGIAVTLMSG